MPGPECQRGLRSWQSRPQRRPLCVIARESAVFFRGHSSPQCKKPGREAGLFDFGHPAP